MMKFCAQVKQFKKINAVILVSEIRVIYYKYSKVDNYD